jgi:hypothetical protein
MSDSFEVQSVSQFLDQVSDEPRQPDTAITLLRGQLQDLPLLPKLFRAPNGVEAVQKKERAMLEYLRAQAPHLRPSTPNNEWDWMSLGQHYGMSTRMSDWSANPLVALFFAVELDPAKAAQPLVFRYPIQKNYIEVSKEGSPLDIQHTRVVRVGHHSRRSEAQAAWQVVHAVHETGDGSHRFIPLEQMPPHDSRITKIRISSPHVPDIRAELAQWGITHSTIYGDFGWVCRSIAPIFGFS